jgi:hypothetical protein
MGRAKQMMLEEEEYSLGNVKSSFICYKHINDYAIANYIKRSTNKGKCTYCEEERSIVSLEKLMLFILEGINKFYEDAANCMPYDYENGGYLGPTFDKYDIVGDFLNIEDFVLEQDINDAFSDTIWSKNNMYDISEKDLLESQWELFKNVVKYKSRYMFSQTSLFKTDQDSQKAYDIFKKIKRGIIPLGIISKIEITTQLFRVRQHTNSEKIIKFDQIASTPNNHAVYANRMSPAGISMFYCAFEFITAYKETVDQNSKKKSKITSAVFQNKRELKVIDLTNLKDISIFDNKKRPHYFLNLFLKAFVEDLSKNILHDGKEHIEYVPTQIVTEFFRYPFSESKKTPIDGIIYPSSKNIGKKACVLFFDNEQCLKELDLITLKTTKNIISK